MKGFRHVLQGEPQRDLMLDPTFMKGIGLLKAYNFTYDILIFPDQLKYIPKFAASFPEQKFVIDHIAKPDIKNRKIDDWKKDIETVAGLENVWCKISGMVTEADWKGWKKEDFTPYLDVITGAFGIDRIMFGSDWPVCLVAGGYGQMISLVKDYFASFSTDEQELFFGKNAAGFYRL
jgi:L-fuconolactonase